MTAGKKALFLDMDGTTLNSENQISEENIRALEKVMKAGHEVIIATGRPMSSAEFLLEKYGLDKIGCRYAIAFNGGMLMDTRTGEILYQKTIPLPHLRELILRAREQNIYVQTYVGNLVLAEQENESLTYYTAKNGMEKKVIPDLAEGLTEAPGKALAIDMHSPEPLMAFKESLKDWAADKLDMYLSCREFLEIVPKGVSKGNALLAFCERTQILAENTVAAGDEQNDISMLEAAGTGCAVANAQPEVKAAADYVTERDNNHSAIAEIVEKFIIS